MSDECSFFTIRWAPSPVHEPVNVATVPAGRGGSLRHVYVDPTLARLRVMHAVTEEQVQLISRCLHEFFSAGLIPVGLDGQTWPTDAEGQEAAVAQLVGVNARPYLPVMAGFSLGPEQQGDPRDVLRLQGQPDVLREVEDRLMCVEGALAEARDEHAELVRRLRADCLRVFGRAEVPSPGQLEGWVAERATVVNLDPVLRQAALDAVSLAPRMGEQVREPECEQFCAAVGHLGRLADMTPRLALTTRRPVSPGAEALLGVDHPVLDGQGLVRLVDYMGTDEHIARVARVSTGSERQDLGILGYLVRHRHTSPIEFGEVELFVRVPIFIARQWVRHRTASISERSLRYQGPLDTSWAYVPPPEFCHAAGEGVKQGRGDALTQEQAHRVREMMTSHNDDCMDLYQALARGDSSFPGVAPELARSNLPLGTMTEWYWKIDLHNLMHWLRLRLDNHAQLEFRDYARPVYDLFRAGWPALAEAFRMHVLAARTFSDDELEVLGHLLGSLHVSAGGPGLDAVLPSLIEAAGLSSTRAQELREKLAYVMRDRRPAAFSAEVLRAAVQRVGATLIHVDEAARLVVLASLPAGQEVRVAARVSDCLPMGWSVRVGQVG